MPPEALNAHESVRRWFRLPAAIRRQRMRLRASEPHVRTVWLVLLRRIGDEVNFIYAATPDWAKADSYYCGAVEDSCNQGGSHIVLLVPWLTSADLRRLVGDLVTGELPVARTFVPGRIDRESRSR